MKTLRLLLFLAITSISGRARAEESVSLAGQWNFRLGDQATNADAKWFESSFSGGQTIKLPGTMDDAGLGPKNTTAPTLDGPYRHYHYAGPAWYQREIEIPAGWTGKRVTLFLERCRWVTTVWLDDKRIGSKDSLIAPHVYDFGTAVTPGKHRLTICVDNTVKIKLGKFVSALFGGTWGNMNGIIGRIELAATPSVWIDSVQVYPNVGKKMVTVKGWIGNISGKPGEGSILVSVAPRPEPNSTFVAPSPLRVNWTKDGGEFQTEIALGPNPVLWDEFTPFTYQLSAVLATGEGQSEATATFGLREFAAKGTQFTLNGRPIFLRGTLECSVWPLTGYPPTDVESWRKIYQIEKSYGLNFIRFHSWCPPEAAFAAADIEGILVQAEGPIANVPVGTDAARDAFLTAEYQRIVDTYGNHPSFCLMALGNEFHGKDEVLTGWVDMLINRDPRRLYSSPTAWQTTANRQWTETHDGRGIKGAGTARDLGDIVAKDGRPAIGHEIGQWMYWPDFNEIKKWTGVMALKNFELIRDDLEKKNLLDQESDFVQATGHFATLLYKEEIEVLLRTPGYGGFSLLDLHDYPTQGTAVIGPLDAFWDSKGFITPEQFRRYCSPVVPLLRLPKRVYTSGEPFSASADLANYGAADLTGVQPLWTIKDGQGREIASGKLSPGDAPTGKLTSLGHIEASLAAAPVPCKLTVSIGLRDTKFFNDWDIWVYPTDATPPVPANVAVCSKWDDAKAALAMGGKVIFFPRDVNPKQSLSGKFLPVFWSPVWFPDKKPLTMGLLCDPKGPLFAHFPTESYSNWQWFDLMDHAQEFILDGTPAGYRPLVQVIDNFSRNHKLGVIFEGRVGSGTLLVSGFDLPRLTNDPVARQLLASVYAYADSADFQPQQQLDPALLENLFTPPKTTSAPDNPLKN